ncbi:MAG: hypothetical protein KY475_04415 [Planctomycetes bacterium]|nr:hypothetical protein [Planctomycetota bacterium]
MPATEQTWRNQHWLHAVFAVTGVLMLLSTVWMFYADHTREWKDTQRTFIDIETRQAAWRDEAMAADIEKTHERLQSRLLSVRGQPVADNLVAEFTEEVKQDAVQRGYALDPEVAEEQGIPVFDEAQDLANIEDLSQTSTRRGARAVALRGLAELIDELVSEQERTEQTQQAQQAAGEGAPAVSGREQSDLADQAFQGAQQASELQQQAQNTEEGVFESGDAELFAAIATSLREAGEAAAKADKLAVPAETGEEKQGADEAANPEEARQARLLAGQRFAEAYQRCSEAAVEAEAGAAEVRDNLLSQMRDILRRARFREDSLLRDRKFKAAQYDEARAVRDLYVRDNLAEQIPPAQAEIDRLKKQLDALNIAYQDASQHRRDLQETIGEITAEADAVEKEIAENRNDLERLRETIEQQRSTFFASTFPWLGKRWLEMPILDAFNSPRKIDNLWTEGLTIQYGSFSKVRRFDRCTTCHQAIVKTMPGSAVDGAYPHGEEFQLVLATPDRTQLPETAEGEELTLDEVYGLQLADRGLISRDEVAVSYVRNESRAARATLVSDVESQSRPGAELMESLLHTEGYDQEELERPQPGLMLGDVIVRINDTYVRDRTEAVRLLLHTVKWGEPLTLTVRRGLPHPYASHPRLDLFLGSLSPHPMTVFGCTVCHEGQGSATAFKWASHTPNTPREAEEWREEHGWFYNHHWIFPMQPERFAESTCLKCHHDVTELEPSEKFPEPPAPKVVQGHDLIAAYGCFGCHEINGFDGPNRRIGPDLRLEPNYYAAAQQLLSQVDERRQRFGEQVGEIAQKLEAAAGEGGVLQGADLSNVADLQQRSDALQQELKAWEDIGGDLDEATQQRLAAIREVLPQLAAVAESGNRLQTLNQVTELAGRLAVNPELDAPRRELHRLILQDIDLAQGERPESVAGDVSEQAEAAAVLPPESHELEPLLRDVEVPGTLRKAGPALRYVASKDDEAFLLDWIRKPSHFRPDTRMPQFFGLHEHLKAMAHAEVATELPDTDTAAESREPADAGASAIKVAEAFEPVEILGMTLYLLDRSQNFEFLEPPENLHDWTEEEQITRGKILFETRGCLACHNHEEFPEAADYRYDGEIVQGPNLSGIGSKFDSQRNPVGPQWLYSWIKEPTRYHARTKMPDLFLDPYEDEEGRLIDPALDIARFLLSHQREDWQPAFPESYVLNSEGNLPADSLAETALRDLSLQYLTTQFYERAAEDYYETGVPEELRDELKGAEVELISESLNDRQRLIYVGAKALSKYGCYGCHDIPGFEDAKPIGTGLADWGRKDTSRLAFEHITHYLHHQHQHGHAGHGEAPPGEADEQPLPPYYEEALTANHREGFIFQKLREPRSYDFEKAENKGYNEWLRMPQFPFNNDEREQVITFVLGLVAEPPAPQFIYQPDERSRAIHEGRRVLAKYNCGGCHTLEMEKWDLSFPPGEFREPPTMEAFDFVRPDFTPEQLAESQRTDRRGMLHATITGQPFLDNDGMPTAYDEFGDPVQPGDEYDPAQLEHLIQIFEPAAIDGNSYMVGPAPMIVKAARIEKSYPAHGGYLARYLVPRVVDLERQANPQAKASEAWGWVPPPLVGEGRKVQPEWLYNFLLDPYPIRPAVFLRMPKFNMSGAEAQALVDYFAAKDNAAYPYDRLAHRRRDVLETKAQQYGEQTSGAGRFDDAMRIVTNNAGCVKCHLVGDFAPQGSPRALAPDLADAYRRLRAGFVRPWIAKPDSILPYTGMPMNINPNTGFATQGLYHGTPEEQLDALVDLLMNYDHFAQQKTSIAELVQAANPPMTGEEGAEPATGEAAEPATGAAAASGGGSGEANSTNSPE